MKDEKKRTLYLKVRVSPEEMAAIKKKFENSGMSSLSTFVRAMIFEGYIVHIDENELKRLTVLANNIANNINQIAHRANVTNKVYKEDIEEIKELEQCYDDVCDQVDGISVDLAGVEDLIGENTFGSVSYDNDAALDSEMAYEVTCPTCNETTYLNENSLNSGVIKCPSCGEILELGYVEDELDGADDKSEAEE